MGIVGCAVVTLIGIIGISAACVFFPAFLSLLEQFLFVYICVFHSKVLEGPHQMQSGTFPSFKCPIDIDIAS